MFLPNLMSNPLAGEAGGNGSSSRPYFLLAREGYCQLAPRLVAAFFAGMEVDRFFQME